MSNVPSYSELGKTYKDFFNQGYYFGILKLGTKNRTCRERSVNTTGTHTIEDGSSFWELETRMTYTKYGCSYISKWNTEGLMGVDIFHPLGFLPGVTIGVGGLYNFESKTKLAKILFKYNHKNRATLDLGMEGGDETPVVANGSLVLGYNNFLAGYQVAYNTEGGDLTKNNIALGYEGCNFNIHGAIENLENCCVGIHHKTTANLDTGVEINYKPQEEQSTKMGIAVAYRINPFTTMRAKFNTQSEIGLGYEIKIKEGCALTLAAFVDAKNLGEGGTHKIGMGLEFEQ